MKISLEEPEGINYFRATALETDDTLFSEGSLVKYKLEFLTHTIPSDGYIAFKLPFSMRIASNNLINWRCEPGKNIPRAKDRSLECIKNTNNPG